MFERFTDHGRKIMKLADQEARRLRHDSVAPEHILLGLLKVDPSMASAALKALNIDLRALRLHLERMCSWGDATPDDGKLPLTQTSKRLIERAINEARNINHNFIGSEHLLLALLHEEDSPPAEALRTAGITLESARAKILRLLNSDAPPSQPTGPLAAKLNDLLIENDPILRAMILDGNNYDADSGEPARLNTRFDQRLAKRLAELHQLVGDKGCFSRALAEAIRSTPPDTPITSARLLVALIKSDPELHAALASLVPQIMNALEADKNR